jgi:hypothetical protein
MHVVVRTYSGPGAKELFDRLEAHNADVERVIRAVSGFVSYSLIRTDAGGISVTVCRDKNGTDESIRAAREWVEKNASDIKAAPPSVAEGPAILQLS